MTIEEAFTILDRMDADSVERFDANEQEAIITLGTEIFTRGPATERVVRFLRARGLIPEPVN